MTIGFGIFIIVAALAVAYLYWDKCRECAKWQEKAFWFESTGAPLPQGLAIWMNKSKAELEQEIDDIAREVAKQGMVLVRRRSLKNGWEYEYKVCVAGAGTAANHYKIYVLNPAIEIAVVDATHHCVHKDLSCEDVVTIVAVNHLNLVELHLWEDEE